MFLTFNKLCSKGTLRKSFDISITFAALEKLIDTNLKWPGNIRQLQALAKIVANYAEEKSINNDKFHLIINDSMVELGMNNIKMI